MTFTLPDRVLLEAVARSHALTHDEQRALTRLLGGSMQRDTLDDEGRGACPMCGLPVRGEPRTVVSYWHPVEDCRYRLHRQLIEARRLLALHGVEVGT